MQFRYVDITDYQLFVVNAIEKWSDFSLKAKLKLNFNTFNFYKPQ